MALVWESYKLDPYVQKLAEAVFNFQEKVQDLFLPNDRCVLVQANKMALCELCCRVKHPMSCVLFIVRVGGKYS